MLGICACMFVPAPALVQINWDGDTSSVWRLGNNWDDAGGAFPGEFSGDSAVIAVNTQNPVTVSGTVANSITTLTLDADTNAATVELDILSGGSLTTTGLVTVKADQEDAANHATIKVGGTLTADSFLFDGAADIDDGHAIGDFDVNVCVNNGVGTDTTVAAGYTDWELASGVVFSAADVILEHGAFLTVTGGSVTSELRMDSFDAGPATSVATVKFVGPMIATVPSTYACP